MIYFDENHNLSIPTIEVITEAYKLKYSENWGNVNLSPSSALGSDLAITSEMERIASENLQDAFLQNSPFQATGDNLDNLCFLRGIFRAKNR